MGKGVVVKWVGWGCNGNQPAACLPSFDRCALPPEHTQARTSGAGGAEAAAAVLGLGVAGVHELLVVKMCVCVWFSSVPSAAASRKKSTTTATATIPTRHMQAAASAVMKEGSTHVALDGALVQVPNVKGARRRRHHEDEEEGARGLVRQRPPHRRRRRWSFSRVVCVAERSRRRVKGGGWCPPVDGGGWGGWKAVRMRSNRHAQGIGLGRFLHPRRLQQAHPRRPRRRRSPPAA